jgi:uncharacterized protein YbjT (DUF2867 family)
MDNINKTAVVFGATGLVGKELIKLLLNDDRYEKVKIFTRWFPNISHPKLEEHIIDFARLEEYSAAMKADHVYCCLGTTAKKTPDKKAYEQIDLHLPVKIAEISRKNGCESYAVISSVGANEKSSNFYLRTKGLMEKGILLTGNDKIVIVRPSMLLGAREEKRSGESIAQSVMSFASVLLIGGLKKYKPIEASKVASAMVYLSNNKTEKSIFENNELLKLN